MTHIISVLIVFLVNYLFLKYIIISQASLINEQLSIVKEF